VHSGELKMNTFCPECGPNVSIDEDGCCVTCGATAIGSAVNEAVKYWDYCVLSKSKGW
jgi:hypothetical protein